MTDLSLLSSTVLSMTSLEIASLVDSRHDNVKRTIETLVAKEVIRLPQSEDSEGINNLGLPQKTKVYVFSGPEGKRDSIVVVAQLSPEFTGRLVDRWQELEGKQVPQIEPGERGEQAMKLAKQELSLFELFKVPDHVAQVEVVKTVLAYTGVDYSRFLLLAPAQNNVAKEEVMLEPNDLAKKLNIKDGATFNRWLAEAGYQVKDAGGNWAPTEAGKAHSAVHQWSTKFKTGYNLKWNLEFVKSLLPTDWPVNP